MCGEGHPKPAEGMRKQMRMVSKTHLFFKPPPLNSQQNTQDYLLPLLPKISFRDIILYRSNLRFFFTIVAKGIVQNIVVVMIMMMMMRKTTFSFLSLS
jgi:hypothetical protein